MTDTAKTNKPGLMDAAVQPMRERRALFDETRKAFIRDGSSPALVDLIEAILLLDHAEVEKITAFVREGWDADDYNRRAFISNLRKLADAGKTEGSTPQKNATGRASELPVKETIAAFLSAERH